jgi:glucuronoarabinoxylan endo-1,4-beta-xylanase
MIDILAAHGYGGTFNPPSNTYGKRLWESEISKLEGPFDGTMSDGLFWAGKIHEFMTAAGVNAWHYWWLITSGDDNQGLTDRYGNPAKRMYTLGNFSKFVRPGYYRLGTSDDGSFLISAYKDSVSGKFAIVAINNNSGSIAETFNFVDFSAQYVTPWITSETLNLVEQSPIAISGSSFSYTLPGYSVVTFVGHCTMLGDLTNDGWVDFKDFAKFSTYWLNTNCGTCGEADLNGDGDVIFEDLAIFSDYWLVGTEP